MLLPVITQGGDVMPVLAATRQASYVSRSSVGKTCSTCYKFEGSKLDNGKNTYTKKHKSVYSSFSGVFFLFNYFYHAKWNVTPPITK